MFSVYYMYICHVMMSRAQYIRHRLQHTCSVYFMIANRTKERLLSLLERWHGPKNLRSRNLREGLAKIPYYIVACLLQSPDFVTLAVL